MRCTSSSPVAKSVQIRSPFAAKPKTCSASRPGISPALVGGAAGGAWRRSPSSLPLPVTTAAAMTAVSKGRKSNRRTCSCSFHLPGRRWQVNAQACGIAAIDGPGVATRSVFGATKTMPNSGSITACECAAQNGRSCRASTRRRLSSNHAVQSEKHSVKRSLRPTRLSSDSTPARCARLSNATAQARSRNDAKGKTLRQTNSPGSVAHSGRSGAGASATAAATVKEPWGVPRTD
mmetsp:Transcript_27324/g.50191  ORF Transcript_27324/g.50191 Transcript_27324/m.50191 type:complete len:234 (+) Transcript_27324:24-725(+)